MSIFKRRNRSVFGLLASVAGAIFLLPVSGASAATQANACVNNIIGNQSSSIPITMTASLPATVESGASFTLSDIEQQLAVPPQVFLSGYGLELYGTGEQEVPAKVTTTIAATNTTVGDQATNTAATVAKFTITDPDEIPGNASPGEEASAGVVTASYNNQTWTAAGAPGEIIEFREATVIEPLAPDPPGFTTTVAGVTIEAIVGAIKAKFGCDPGEVVEAEPPNTIVRTETAVTFASVQVVAPVKAPTPSPSPSPAAENKAPNTKLKSVKIKKRNVTFKFTSNEKGSTFLCKLDKKKFAKCKSPKTYKNLKPGKHKFQVKARDSEGKVDPSPVVKKFKIKARRRKH